MDKFLYLDKSRGGKYDLLLFFVYTWNSTFQHELQEFSPIVKKVAANRMHRAYFFE